MRRFKKLFVALLVVATVLGTVTTFASAGPLADIEGTKYEAAVKALTGLNIVTGFPDGTYKPNATLTRAMAAAIMVRALGLEETAKLSKGATPFSDVPATDWASGYVNVAFAQGTINGIGNNQFAPLREVTYAELATMLVRAAGLAKEAVGPWPTNFITVATKYGLTAGTGFSASKPATRGDTALMTNVAVFDTKNPDTNKTIAQTVFNVGPKLDKVVVTAGATSVAVGGTVQLTAKAYDTTGAEIKDAAITWSADKGGVVNSSGVFAASASGTSTITATSGDKSGTVAINVYGNATALKLSAPAAIVANGLSKTTITATAVDAAGNTVQNFSGTISFQSTNTATAKVSAGSVAAVNGVASIDVTSGSTTSGTAVLSASSTGLTGATAVVTANAQVLTSIALSADPGNFAADNSSQATITATPKDQEGVTMAAPAGLSVKVTSSNTSVASFAGGLADANINIWPAGTTLINAKNLTGNASITGVVTAPSNLISVPVTSTAVNAIVVGAPYKLAIDPITSKAVGTAQTVTVRVLDVNGNQVTGLYGGSYATVNLTADGVAVSGGGLATGGKLVFSNTTNTAGNVTYEATATWSTATLVKATATGSFTPGTAAIITLSAAPTTLRANGLATSTLTAKITDAYGNLVTDGSYAVKFSKTSDGNATVDFADTTVNTTAGVATFALTSTTNIGVNDTITASAINLVSDTAGVTTALFGNANKLALEPITSKTVGSDMTVVADVQDYDGRPVTDDNGRAVTLTAKNSLGNVVGTYTANSANGKAIFTVNFTTKGSYSFTASASGLISSDAASGLYNASPIVAALKLTPDLTTLANGGSVSDMTVDLLDKYGNVTTPSAGIAVTISASPGDYGTLAVNNPDVAGGLTKLITDTDAFASFTTNANAGPTLITVSAPGVASASATVTSQVVGSPAKLAISTISDTVADGVKTQNVAVTVLDAAGNRVTNATNSITLATASGSATIPPAQAAVKGQTTFAVTDTVAESISYTASATDLTSATASGKFIAGSADKFVFATPSPNWIKGDGSMIASYTLKVTDAQGNLVPTGTGNATISITSGNDYATLLTPTVSVAGGQATVMVQAKTTTSSSAITLGATTSDIKKSDGITNITDGFNTDLVIDGVSPSVTISVPANNLTPTMTVTYTGEDGDSGQDPAATVKQYREPSVSLLWSTFTDSTTTLVAGHTYDFRATVADKAGHSTTSATLTLTVDTTAPTATAANTGTAFTVTFSEAVNATEATTLTNYALAIGSATTVGTITGITYDATTHVATVNVTSIAAGNTLTVSVGNSIHDLAGNAMAAWTYTAS
ncbi:MAG: beta strand repeat-containing protein [Bacillota bacterium]